MHRPSPTRLRALAVAALVLASLAACSSGGAVPSDAKGAPPPPSSTATPSGDASGDASGAPADSPGGFRSNVPLEPTTIPGAEGAPATAIAVATADAAGRAGIDPTQVTVVTNEFHNWPDGSLGCRKLGVMYIQVVTPGYRLVLDAGGARYDYRGSLRGGDPNLCENPLPGGVSGAAG